ncbi:hypothetical protein [Metallosphaera sp.]|uniref:hypothetical protein n=1 Tax=Metallosphaera sp. TaxID=2020860 RepID=UPI0031727A13
MIDLLAIRILAFVPSVVFLFFSIVYYVLYLMEVPLFHSKDVRNLSMLLLVSAVTLLSVVVLL